MILNDAAKEMIARFPLGVVGTVTPDGRPVVSPKGTFLLLDDATIGFGEIRSRCPRDDDGVSAAKMIALYKLKFAEVYP
ncbi:MAG: pyridoxamine 5'-phosphate oxidase family protein [Roseovarius sp.]|jgi:hypothetical protein|nr:pyridoxamine 5'-phosphate oxidase family protein [Roseovarius sp.]